jgi:hypothetical protein
MSFWANQIYRAKAVTKYYMLHDVEDIHVLSGQRKPEQLRTGKKTKDVYSMFRKFVLVLTTDLCVPLQCPRCLKLQRYSSKHIGSRVVGPPLGGKEYCVRKGVEKVISPSPTALPTVVPGGRGKEGITSLMGESPRVTGCIGTRTTA